MELRADPATASAEDGVLRRGLRNFGVLLGGRAFAGVLSTLATLWTARVLEPAAFGTVVLIYAYLLSVRGLLNMRSADVVVRFGARSRHEGELASLTGTTLKLDAALALSATTVAMVGAPWLVPLFGGEDGTAALGVVAGAALLVSGTGTAKGVLRLNGLFGWLAGQRVVGSATRLVGVALAAFVQAPLEGFLWAWVAGYVVESIYLFVLAAVALARSGTRPDFGLPLRAVRRRHVGFWHYVFTGYWQSTLELVPKQFSTLMIGGLLDAGAAGMFRLAQDVTNVAARPAALMRHAVLTDLSRMWSMGSLALAGAALKLVGAVMLPALALLAVAWLFAEPLIELALGAAYLPAADILVLLLAASVLELASAPLRAAVYAMGRPGAIVLVQLLATGVYLALFVSLSRTLGLIGPGIAACVFALALLVGMLWLLLASGPARGASSPPPSR